jgi:hypothetical protein
VAVTYGGQDWTAQKLFCRLMIAKPAWCKTPCTSPNKLCTVFFPNINPVTESPTVLQEKDNHRNYGK